LPQENQKSWIKIELGRHGWVEKKFSHVSNWPELIFNKPPEWERQWMTTKASFRECFSYPRNHNECRYLKNGDEINFQGVETQFF
jgi:hypothetical protein